MKSIFKFLTIFLFLLSPMAQAFDLNCSVEFYGENENAYDEFEIKDLEIDYFHTDSLNFQIYGRVEKAPNSSLITIKFGILEYSKDLVIGVGMIFPENNPNASWQADIPYKNSVVWVDDHNNRHEVMSELASIDCTVTE